MILFIISFVGGVLTVLAPCILPLLPVIVGGSLTDGKIHIKKALTIIIALGVSVIAFTFILKVSTLFIHIPPYTWTLISGGIVLLLGIVTLFPSLWESRLLARLSSRSNMLLGKGNQKNSFWGDVIIGAALGPIFSTCSPTYFIVLATVLPVNPALGIVYLLAYTVGLGLALLIVTFVGQKILAKLDVAADPRGTFKKVLGIIFIIVGIAILSGYDKKIETAITSAGFFDVTKVEQKLLEKNVPATPTATTPEPEVMQALPITEEKKPTVKEKPVVKTNYIKAPEISTPDGFINTDGKPITLASLRGKVVLLDIWTYSCINCQRTIPYLNDWYAKYKDQGFEIIGLHTPEFGFEKVQSNVEKAVKGFNIKYPVVMDNDYSTWRALGNQYWPRKYLIDTEGNIIYDHIGEGGYEETELQIQKALNVKKAISTPSNVIRVEANKVNSPETYFGSSRNEYLNSLLFLDGKWNIQPEYAESSGAAAIRYKYEAKNVYMTAGSDTGAEIEIYKDDVFVKKIIVKDETLYTLIEGAEYGTHSLKINIIKGSLKAFTFTFG